MKPYNYKLHNIYKPKTAGHTLTPLGINMPFALCYIKHLTYLVEAVFPINSTGSQVFKAFTVIANSYKKYCTHCKVFLGSTFL
jgi:hypothetical protein